jgi:D-alanyl-D-alanine carboxypeptidase
MRHLCSLTLTFLLAPLAFATGSKSPNGCKIGTSPSRLQELVNKYLPNGSNGRPSAAAIYKTDGQGKILQNLFEKNPHSAQAVASTQKIVTAFVTSKYVNLNSQVEFSNLDLAFDVEGGRGVYHNSGKQIEVGDKVGIPDLLNTLFIQSSNGAAQALSRGIDGSTRSFVNLMNSEVTSILAGESNKSYFQNPHGLTDNAPRYRNAQDPTRVQKSTANNMARILGYILGQDVFKRALSKAGLSDASRGYLGKPGATQAAGKTYVYHFPLTSSNCQGAGVSMAFFGDSSNNQFERLRELCTQVRDEILGDLGILKSASIDTESIGLEFDNDPTD